MTTVFADSAYWIAIANPRDQWHDSAKQARKRLGNQVELVTTDAVLTEFLTGLSASGDKLRERAVTTARAIINDPNIRVIPHTRTLFHKALDLLYEERPDKEYSLQDCISMVVMKDGLMANILTSDHHFEQECFVILMKSP